jgi:cell division septum initiation protein DivIVA
MSDLDKANPEFTISIRGYDRIQVDEYIHRLQELLDEAAERTRAAESELEFSRHTTVGPRVSEIFELAVAEAKEIRARVEEEERTRLASASQLGDEMVEAARQAAEELAANSRREHDEMVREMEAEHDRRNAEVTRLAEQKAQMLGELRRLHEALGSVANLAVPTAEVVSDSSDQATRELPPPPEMADRDKPAVA